MHRIPSALARTWSDALGLCVDHVDGAQASVQPPRVTPPLAGTSQHAVPPPTSAACLLAGTREGRVAPTHRVTGAPRMIAARSQSRARARRRRGAAPCPTDLARCLQWRRLLSKCISAAAPHYISTRRRTLQAPITPDQTG